MEGGRVLGNAGVTSVFCERYRGQGQSRSPVMLGVLLWGVSDGKEQCERGFWSTVHARLAAI